VEKNYFDLKGLGKIDPAFRWPGFTFNTGQWIGRAGRLKREDFLPFLNWTEPRTISAGDCFKFGEQGLLNYVLMKKAAEGEIQLERRPIMRVADTTDALNISVSDLLEKRDQGFVVHWCGLKAESFNQMLRGDLWRFFERSFYSTLHCGPLIKLARAGARLIEHRARGLVRGITREP
jgi:hypothetical protein